MSPDPIIQNPYDILSYNRYSYCLYNPLKYTDPSGYSYKKSMAALYGEGNYWYRGQAPGTWTDWESFHYNGGAAPVHNGVKTNDLQGGMNWIDLGNGIKIKVVKKSNLMPDGYYQDHYELILGVYGKEYSDYNWVQLTNHDGTLMKDGLNNNGFYYFDSDKPSIANYRSDIPGANYYFEDTPNAKSFYAYLTLCGKTGDQWVPIATFTWGYNSNGNKSIYFNQINNVPSDHLNYLNATINYFNHH